MKDPMDENVTAGNIIADWPLRYFTTAWVIGECCEARGPHICDRTLQYSAWL
jgi:hypothetical protein